MRVECEKCGRWFDDEFRSWNCPHRRINPGMSVDLEPPEDPRSQWTTLYSWGDYVRAILFGVGVLGVIVCAVILFLRALGR